MNEQFPLEQWEYFEAPINAAGDKVWITEVWIDDAQGRIFGASPMHGDPVWLSPKIVPGRVIRRDTSKPKHHLEWREIMRRGQVQIDLDDDEKLLRRLAEAPEPEVRARPATLKEMPQGLRTLGKKAHEAGFTQEAFYARGPRFNQYWQVVEISDNFKLSGRHPDGRRFVTTYISKTPNLGKPNQEKPKFEQELGYALIDGLLEPCTPSRLEAYFTNGSLIIQKEAPHA